MWETGIQTDKIFMSRSRIISLSAATCICNTSHLSPPLNVGPEHRRFYL